MSEMKVSITDKQLLALKRDWFVRGFNAAMSAIYDQDADPSDRLNLNHPQMVRDRNKAFADEQMKK